jgi:hypothetical protein
MMPRSTLLAAAAALLAATLGGSALSALEEQAGEAQALQACDERLCRILLQRNPAGEDLKCRLTKTWTRSTIKEAEQSDIKWGFGDARCSIDIAIARAAIVGALNGERKAKFWAPPHTAHCLVEHDGRLERVTATLAPKIVFKNGKADKVWINLMQVDGPPAVQATLSTAAQLSDGLGIFHRQLVKAVNRFIYRHCPKSYPSLQAAK